MFSCIKTKEHEAINTHPLWLFIVLITQLPLCIAEQNPLAHSQAMVVDGYARFTLLSTQLIRIEWADDRQFEDRASLTFINRRLPVPEFQVRRQGHWLEIDTVALKVRYRSDAKSLTADTLQVAFKNAAGVGHWQPGMSNPGNLLGTVRTVDGFEGRVRVRDSARLELEPGIVSRDGWSLVDDSSTLLFDGDPGHNRAVPRPVGKRFDGYLFAHGHNYKQALGDFIAVAGKIPMPPRYAFGYWWSRYWVYSDSELRALVQTIQAYDIPLDVLVIDMDWHETHGLTSNNAKKTPFNGMLGWTGYSWNRSLFPAPEKFLQWAGQQGLQVALNLHPADGIAPFERSYQAMHLRLGKNAPKKGEWIPYTLSYPEWAAAYFDTVLRPHENIGVDFWWLDWQQWPLSKQIDGLNNTFWLNHVFFNDARQHYPQRRPLLFHRWGGLGNHRYQVGFSGDAVISWKSLAFQPFFTATASNVGYGYWSHDIGGHIDVYDDHATDGELYLRWIQYGVLSPIFRTHSSKSDIVERRIWKYPEYFTAMRDAIRLRYSLFPYFYTYARIAYDTGVSLTRPMYYNYPDVDIAYAVPQQFMLGEQIIVAPVASPVDKQTQLASQDIWLPKGDWYEWSSGHLLKGGQSYRRRFAIDEIPIYVKAGAIIPRLPDRINNLRQIPNNIVLAIFPGDDGNFRYYEDDGIGQAYQSNGAVWTEISTQRAQKKISVNITAPSGHYDGMGDTRQFTLRFERVAPAAAVQLNGVLLADKRLRYDARTLTQFIDLPESVIDQPLNIIVSFSIPLDEMARQLDGKPGLFRRLQWVSEQVKLLSAREDWAATVPNALLTLVETSTRIHYYPERLQQDLKALDRGLHELEAIIASMVQISDAEASTLTQHLVF